MCELLVSYSTFVGAWFQLFQLLGWANHWRLTSNNVWEVLWFLSLKHISIIFFTPNRNNLHFQVPLRFKKKISPWDLSNSSTNFATSSSIKLDRMALIQQVNTQMFFFYKNTSKLWFIGSLTKGSFSKFSNKLRLLMWMLFWRKPPDANHFMSSSRLGRSFRAEKGSTWHSWHSFCGETIWVFLFKPNSLGLSH